MLRICLLVLLLITPILATLANRQDGPQPTPAPQYAKRYLYDCSDAEKEIEGSAWKDHLRIAKEALKWKPGKKWQPAFDMYMGTDSKDKPWRDSIKNAQKNQVKVHRSNWIWPDSWLYIYCKEKNGESPYKKGVSYCDSSTYAYSFIVKGWFHNSYNIVFCNKYYNEKSLADTIINNIKAGHHDKMDAAYMWTAYGQTYYHELMHFPSLVNDTLYNGQMPDIIKPFQLKLVARNHGCKGSWFSVPRGARFWASSMYAADAYATAGTIAFFQEQLKLGDVPTVAAADGIALDSSGDTKHLRLPDLDARNPSHDLSNLPYNATKEDWSFEGLGLTENNRPLLYPDSTITEDEFNKLVAEADQPDPQPDDKPDIECGPNLSYGGSIEVLTKNVADFCSRDFSIDQQLSWTDDGTGYSLFYANPGQGYCNMANCKSSIEAGLRLCQYNSHSIYKNGKATIPCGTFSWELRPTRG